MDTIPDSDILTLRTYAKRRGCNKEAVSRAISTGRLDASVARDLSGKVLGIRDPALADQEWEANTLHDRVAPKYRKDAEGGGGAAKGEPDLAQGATLSQASAAEKFWKAKSAELNFRKEASELVEVAKVEQKIGDAFTRVKTRLLGIPSRAKQAIPHLTIPEIATLQALIREALEELAQ